MQYGAISALGRSGVFRRFLRSASGFWQGPSASTSWALVVSLVIIVLLGLLTQIGLNIWTRDFFDALERKDGTALFEHVLTFLPLVLASIVLAILGVWCRMTTQRRWREWMSRHLISLWVSNGRYRRLALLVDDHQSPEYRIAEDARVATDAPVDFAVGLLTSTLTAVAFIVVLWNVGGNLDTRLLGREIFLPGYLVLAAIAYASFTTCGMLVIGRHLVQVFEGKNQAEAELRQSATGVRESALRADTVENHSALHASLQRVIDGWRKLCWQLMQTTVITHGNTLMAPVVALALCAPKYLNDAMSLGEVTQAAVAFVTVQGAFNWLVDNYPRLADWASSANRVGSLLESFDTLDRQAATHEIAGSETTSAARP